MESQNTIVNNTLNTKFLSKKTLIVFTLISFLFTVVFSVNAEPEKAADKEKKTENKTEAPKKADAEKKDSEDKPTGKTAEEAQKDNPESEEAKKAETAEKPALPKPKPIEIPKYKDFRLGKVVAAELTKNKVSIKNLNKFDLPKSMEPKKKDEDSDEDEFETEKNYAFAVIAIRLNMGRSISIYDYTLTDGTENFKCIALSKNDADFDTKNWQIKDAKQWDTVKMLYEVQLPTFEVPKIQFSMVNKVLPDKEDEIVLPFKNIKDGKFTPYKKIPANGMLFVEEEKEEEEEAEEKPEEKKDDKKELPKDIGPSM